MGRLTEASERLFPEVVQNNSGNSLRESSSNVSTESQLEETVQWPDLPDESAFHGLAGQIVKIINPHSEADPIAILIQIMTAFGNVIGRETHFKVEADYHASNLFSVLVGTTGNSRKGTSSGYIRRLYSPVDPKWEQNQIQSGLSSGEGLIWAVRDSITKMEAVRKAGRPTGEYIEVISDPGVTDKRLMVLEPEFASLLRVIGRDGNTLSALIRQAWDTGSLRTLTKNSPAKSTGAHISIIGHITKDELKRYLSSTEAGNGFANRFLWVCVKRSKCLPEGGHLDQGELSSLIERLHKAVSFARNGNEINRDNKARAIWFEVYPSLSDGRPGLFGAVTSRAEAQVMRLSCIYALLDMSYVVKAEHLKAALALWEYCEASAKFIFGDSLGDPTADEILNALRKQHNGMTRTDIRDLFGRNRESKETGRALTLLLEHGLAYRRNEDTQGRPVERWFAMKGSTT